MTQSTSKSSIKERAKVDTTFWYNLIKVFLITALLCTGALGYLWYRLDQYEKTTVNGAIRAYMALVAKGDYQTLYEQSGYTTTQFNTEEDYVTYLSSLYDGANFPALTYQKQSYSTPTFSYYAVKENGNTIATLEVTKDTEGQWVVRTQTLVSYWYVDSVDKAMVQFNGTLVPSWKQLNLNIYCYAFHTIKEPEGLNIPKVSRYYIDQIISPPVATPADPNNVVVGDVSDVYFYCAPKSSEAKIAEITPLIEAAAESYARYITADDSFATLRKYLYPGTTFYDDMAGFNNAYFSAHDSIEFLNMQVYDILEFDEDSFIGSISFDYKVTMGDTTQIYSNVYQLTFLRYDGEYRLINLALGQ